MSNIMKITFSSRSENEAFARVSVAAFVSQLDPTLNELTEIKTVVSEAVTNSIIHGYNEEINHFITIRCEIKDQRVHLQISDQGIGIKDIEKAREPLYTSKPELERSGMGFTIIENFMDSITITSEVNEGTTIEMVKELSANKAISK